MQDRAKLAYACEVAGSILRDASQTIFYVESC